MNVLGPYLFLEANDTDECGCGGEYCALLQSGDKIAFQIPVTENCCGAAIVDCELLTEACFDGAGFAINPDYAAAEESSFGVAGLCMNVVDAFPVADYIFQASGSFTSGTKYRINFCIADNDLALGIRVFIGAVESATFTANGNYSVVITAGATGTLDWGIKHMGANNGIILCFGCISLCEAITWTATLIDEEGTEIVTLNETELDNGNIAFQTTLTIPAEIDPGCYQVKLENDCDAAVLYSQCINLRASHSCTLLFKYRDTKNVFGFDYETDAAYYNYLRLKAKLKFPTYPDDTDPFRLSDNSYVQTSAVVQKKLTVALDTPGVPDYVHDAIAVMRRHAEFLIDGTQYVVAAGGYLPDWRRSSILAASSFEVMPQTFDGVNSYCG